MAAVMVACGDHPGAGPAGPTSPMPMRLIDHLGDAEIESPLIGIDAALDADALQIASTPELQEDFSKFSFEDADWPHPPWASITDGDSGSALHLQAPPQTPAHDYLGAGWLVRATPNTHYSLSLRVRAQQPPTLAFAIVELARAPDPSKPARPRLVAAGTRRGLKMHWPSPVEADGQWHRSAVTLQTSHATQALAVILRSTINSPPMQANDVQFDDIRLDRLSPGREQLVALLKPRSLPETPAPHGIGKRGLLLPLRSVDGAQRGDGNYTYRDVLYAPAPTELAFPAVLPPDAVLRFGVSMASESGFGDRARFEVAIRGGGHERSLWTHEAVADPGRWEWHEQQLALADYAGSSVEIVLRTTAAGGGGHAIWGSPVIDVAYRGPGPRNVILIAVDTLRADHLSCHGYDRETSPNIDALAADGVLFEQTCSVSNWTCPTFASIFTGLVPARHRVFSWGATAPLSKRFDTLAERFHRRGWNTNAILFKIPLYGGGYDQGFDASHNVPRLGVQASDNFAVTSQWLAENADRRNFLFLHFDDPHQPFTQPAPFDRLYGDDPASHGLTIPFGDHEEPPHESRWRQLVHDLYDGEIAYVDARIGHFLDDLKARGLYDDALIAFVSDHGEELWEHGTFGHGQMRLYDEVVRVPLIIKPSTAGAAFPRGVVVKSQVRNFDVMPTLLELAGLPVPDEIEARSLVPLLRDPDTEADRPTVIETSVPALGYRDSRWKYVLRFSPEDQSEELYSLREDPAEQTDVASRQPMELERVRTHVLDYVMFHRPGRYLAVIQTEDAAIGVRGVDAPRPLIGRFERSAQEGAVTVHCVGTERRFAVAKIAGLENLAIDDDALPVRPERRYERGTLQRLLAEGLTGVYLFEGPPEIESDTPGTLDLQHEGAMRALGYVGGR